MNQKDVDIWEKRLSNYVALEIFLPAIKFCIVQSIPGWTEYNSIANILLGLFFACLFVHNARVIMKRSGKYVLLSLVALFFVGFSAALYGETNIQNVSQAIVDIIIISCTLFLTTVSIRDHEVLFFTLLKWSPIVIAASVFMVVCTSVIGVVGVAETSYNMSLSYYVVIPCIILFLGYFEKHKIKYLIMAIIGVMVIMAMGSRGPLLCIGLFLFFWFLKTLKKTPRNMVLLLLGVFFAVILLVEFEQIIIKVYNWLLSYNIDSRTLLKIIKGSLFDDSNRGKIINDCVEIIKDNPWGIGFMGNLSAHNIVIENVLWFGIVVGMFFNIVLLVIVIRTLSLKIDIKDKRNILIIAFFCYAIPDALLNLTVWGKDMFWIYVALLLTNKNPLIKWK